MKQCTRCKVEKSLEDFYAKKRGKDNKASYCKKCAYETKKVYYIENKEKFQEKYRMRLYGLTTQEYEALKVKQDHKCKICDKPSKDNLNGSLYVDHCHSTSKVRGLLCLQCNAMLGYSRDRIDLLEKAIDYLKEYKIENKT